MKEEREENDAKEKMMEENVKLEEVERGEEEQVVGEDEEVESMTI